MKGRFLGKLVSFDATGTCYCGFISYMYTYISRRIFKIYLIGSQFLLVVDIAVWQQLLSYLKWPLLTISAHIHIALCNFPQNTRNETFA